MTREEILGNALNDAARELPIGWQISVTVENGSGWARLYNADGVRVDDFDSTDLNLGECVRRGIKLAVWADHKCKPSCHNPCLLEVD
jgi:hypothetical protein